MPASPEILSRDVVYTGRRVTLEVHHVRDARGRETTREVIVHPGAVAILAFPQDGHVLLERNWRYTVGAAMIEIPAGTLVPGEDPAACAARELAEETGYRAGRLEPLISIHPSPGVLAERLTVFLGFDLREGRPALEAGEQIETLLVPVDEALAMIRDGHITDAKTIVALLFWNAWRRGASNAVKGNA